MKKTSFFNALVLALGFGSLQAQYDDKIHVVGEHLSNFSITERCCGKEGYVVAGTRGQNQEVLVTAMDTKGNPAWNVVLNNDQDERSAHIEAVSNGYALTGFTRAPLPSANRTSFVLLNAFGNVVMSKMFYNPNQPDWHMQGTHILEVQNGGGYLITGYYKQFGIAITSQKSVQVLRLDGGGNMLWGKIYDSFNDGRADFDMGAFALETEEGFYITGSANLEKSGGQTTQGVLSMMIDDNGDLIWSNNFAFDGGADIYDDSDLGTSAVYNVDENTIIVSSNSTQNTNYYLSKLDAGDGSVITQKAFNYNNDSYTPSFSLGQNSEGNLVVVGMIESSAVRLHCDGTPADSSSVPYLAEISNDLNTVVAGFKYPLFAPTFSTDDGSAFHSHFGGPLNLKRPLILTPEMAYVHKDQNRVALLGYREDGPHGAYDLQFMGNASPTYDWCDKESTKITIADATPIFGDEMEALEFNEIQEVQGNSEVFTNLSTIRCGSPLISGATQFPITQASTAGGSVMGSRDIATGRNLVVKNGYTYVTGEFTGNMNNPSLSHSRIYAKPWVAKYDQDGTLLWGRRADGTASHNSGVSAIAIDRYENVYVTGYFSGGNLKFDGDPDTVMVSSNHNGHGWSAYLIKYDSNGNFIWRSMMRKDTSVFGSAVLINDIVIDDADSIFVTGIALNNVLFTNNNNPDPNFSSSQFTGDTNFTHHAFVAKYASTTGHLSFFESQPNIVEEFAKFESKHIQLDNMGNIYIGGEKTDSIKYPIILKLNSTATSVLGATQNTSTSATNGSLFTMHFENPYLYVGGFVDSVLSIAGGTLSSLNNEGWFARINVSNMNMDLPSLNTLSSVSGGAAITDIETDLAGDVYIYGSAYGTSSVLSNGGGSLASIGSTDLVVAQYNAGLTSAQWASNFGGSGTIASSGTLVENDLDCGVLITGIFSGGGLDFGFANGQLSAPLGSTDHFIARIDDFGSSYKKERTFVKAVENEASDKLILDGQATLSLYPNPSSGLLTIDLESLDSEKVTVNVYNTAGHLVYTVRPSFSQEDHLVQMNLNHLSSGMYWIKAESKNRTMVGKLIKE